MAPRKLVDGRAVPKLVRPTRQERIAAEKAAKAVQDRAGRLRANELHVAATGKPMPQAGAHRKRNKKK